MTVTFRLHGRCPVCGYRNTAIENAQVRINKLTLVRIRPGIWAIPGDCRECGHPLGVGLFTGLALDPQDEARVQAYRRRRGWAT